MIGAAAIGVPSRAEVMAEFDLAARSVGGEGAGAILQQAASGLNGILRYNRAALRRDEEFRALAAEVAAGDLAAATSRLGRLDGPARQTLAEWHDMASARVRIDAIAAELGRLAHLAILDPAE